MKRHLILGFCAVVAACGQASTSDQVPETTNSAPLAFSEIHTVTPGTLFAAIDPAFGFEAIQDTSKSACLDEAICKVIIFRTGTALPKDFPMTEREVSESIGNYTLNRNSGIDQLLAKCPDVPGTPEDKCLAAG